MTYIGLRVTTPYSNILPANAHITMAFLGRQRLSSEMTRDTLSVLGDLNFSGSMIDTLALYGTGMMKVGPDFSLYAWQVAVPDLIKFRQQLIGDLAVPVENTWPWNPHITVSSYLCSPEYWAFPIQHGKLYLHQSGE
jgi:hypothetical protein